MRTVLSLLAALPLAFAVAACTTIPPATGAGGMGGEGGTGGTNAQTFPCDEQGLRNAIAAGGGPHTFACDGPKRVTTSADILIDNDVILDGEGNLTLDAWARRGHRVLSVPEGVTAELRGLTVTG
ncbi:MAG: hypothetical protein ACN4G0_16690, partial [Polyangiales bacterium]